MTRNWAGNITFSTAAIRRPRTVEQLQELVVAHSRIRALGSGHSFNRVADTTGLLVELAALELSIEVDPFAGTVRVPAGVRYAALATALAEHDLALHNLGSLPHISVAGACATGTHGGGDGNRCLAAAAVAVEFVAGDGSLVSVRAGDSSFGGVVLALGALGIVTRLTLALEPAYEVRQDVWLDTPVEALADRFAEIMGAGYSVSAFTRFARPDVIDAVNVKTRLPAAVADGTGWGARAASSPWHPIEGEDPAAVTEQLGVPGPWYERLPHFRASFTPSRGDEQQTEYLLPRSSGPDAVRALAKLATEPAFRAALLVCEIRTVAADELWLSPCHDRDTVALHFTWRNDDALVGAAVAAVEAAIAPFEPRAHWGKVFGFDPAYVRAGYPRLSDFRALVERYDPERRFGNEFLESYVY